jgi:serine/threonine protein phosphatase PrpC
VEIRLLGRDFETIDAVTGRSLEWDGVHVETVICRGGPAAASKPNEDALLVVSPEEGAIPLLAMVADAHFGGEASELAVTAVARVHQATDWRDRGAASAEEALLRMVRASQGAITARALQSETTLLIVVLVDRTLHWASVGDSYLYRFRPQRSPDILNTPSRVWLGDRLRVPIREVTHRGRVHLEPGTDVLLTTDGIPEPLRNVPTFSPKMIMRLLDSGGQRRLESLARAALDRAGEDNIAAVLLRLLG